MTLYNICSSDIGSIPKGNAHFFNIFNTQVTVNTSRRRDGAITRQLETKLIEHWHGVTCLESKLLPLFSVVDASSLLSAAKAVYSNTDLRDQMIHKVLTEIEGECSTLCKRVLPNTGSPSLFRKIPVGAEVLTEDCVRELEFNASILFKCLMSVCSHSDHRNKDKRGDSHFSWDLYGSGMHSDGKKQGVVDKQYGCQVCR